MKIPMFPCKYHQNGGFSMAMLVFQGVFVLGGPVLRESIAWFPWRVTEETLGVGIHIISTLQKSRGRFTKYCTTWF